MINLLPEQIKKKNIKDYRVFFVAYCFFLLSFVMVFLSVTLLPSYFISHINEKVEVQNLEMIEKRPESIEMGNLVDLISATNKKLSVFSEKENISISRSVVSYIEPLEAEGIFISNYFLFKEKPDDTDYKVEIRGIALSRENLENFSLELRSVESFESIEVPISQYAKGENLEFSISFVLKNQN